MKLHATLAALAASAAVLVAAGSAEARGPYVVLRDDGSLSGKVTDPTAVLESVMKLYDAEGAPRPDVLSVWTAFPMDKNEVETLFDPAGNDVTGIGLDEAYGGDGTFASDYAPLRAMLLHNDVLALEQRAKLQGATGTPEDFAEYLFLLELSHVWGPAVKVPAADGKPADELIGFPFHWSFWMDAGGSPAGGNRWKDNGDGTFTASGQTPAGVTYSMLDLYLMGLADASEVPPFRVLEGAVPPAGAVAPFTKQAYSKTSFPWFGAQPFTVTAASVRTLTIDDVIAANGARSPARGASPSSFDLGIALVVKATATDDDVARAEAAMDPVAARIAPAFARATGGRGAMKVVTTAPEDASDAGAGDDADAAPAPEAPAPSGDEGGCSAAAAPGSQGSSGSGSSSRTGAAAGALAIGLALVAGALRRKTRATGP
jgi:hypothetical protein